MSKCVGQPEKFFPVEEPTVLVGKNAALKQRHREFRRLSGVAEELCSGCDCKRRCARTALAQERVFGIWGGVYVPQSEKRFELRDRALLALQRVAS